MPSTAWTLARTFAWKAARTSTAAASGPRVSATTIHRIPASVAVSTSTEAGSSTRHWANGWGFSMQDHNSVGRLTSLFAVTWADGWPYFGLPGNLKRTPSIMQALFDAIVLPWA